MAGNEASRFTNPVLAVGGKALNERNIRNYEAYWIVSAGLSGWGTNCGNLTGKTREKTGKMTGNEASRYTNPVPAVGEKALHERNIRIYEAYWVVSDGLSGCGTDCGNLTGKTGEKAGNNAFCHPLLPGQPKNFE